MKVSEYDAFGPYIYVIDEDHPVPRLFVPYCPPAESACLQLKLPRKIERREATPDMDLYDYVLSVDDEALTVLERQDTDVKKTVIPYSDMRAVRISRDLLLAVLHVYSDEESLHVPFNAVSVKIMLQLVDILREHYLPGDSMNTDGLEDRKSMEVFHKGAVLFYNLIRDLNDRGENILCGSYQAAEVLHYCGKDRKLKRAIKKKKPMLPGAAHLMTTRELLIVEQAEMTEQEQKNNYGYQYTYIPLQNLTGIRMISPTDYSDVSTVAVTVKKSELQYHISSGNEDVKNFYKKMEGLIARAN